MLFTKEEGEHVCRKKLPLSITVRNNVLCSESLWERTSEEVVLAWGKAVLFFNQMQAQGYFGKKCG